MDALTNLNNAVTALTNEVTADLAALQTVPTSATIQAAADAINAQTAKLAAARATLTPAG